MHTNFRRLVSAIVLVACISPIPTSASTENILVLSALESAGGATQADLGIPMLEALQNRTVELFTKKAKAALRDKGLDAELPKLQVDSHYLESQGMRLAVIKIRGGQKISNVSLYGIVGIEFRRVMCIRTDNFDEDIPLSYGPCAKKIKEVFGVELRPN